MGHESVRGKIRIDAVVEDPQRIFNASDISQVACGSLSTAAINGKFFQLSTISNVIIGKGELFLWGTGNPVRHLTTNSSSPVPFRADFFAQEGVRLCLVALGKTMPPP